MINENDATSIIDYSSNTDPSTLDPVLSNFEGVGVSNKLVQHRGVGVTSNGRQQHRQYHRPLDPLEREGATAASSSAITFDVDIALRRLYHRIKRKESGQNRDKKQDSFAENRNNDDRNPPWGSISPCDAVGVSVLKEVFPSVWNEFYPGRLLW